MDEAATLPAQGEYKDRRGGLIAFGILQIALGLLCALLLIAIFVAQSLAPQTTMALSRQTMAFSVAFYVCIGAVLIWLGVGSILCRRWARALILIASWGCLAGGIISLGFFAVFARDIFTRATYPAASPAMAFTAALLAIFFILLPGAMVLFYQRKDVAATCAARDPVTRWTDRCPLPVLTCSLWLTVCAIFCLFTPVIYGSIVPWFGTLLTGAPAALVLVVCAAVCLYLAWATYRLRIEGWWMTLAAFTIFSVLATWTLLRIDLMEVYRGLGYPEQQIEQLRNLRFFTGRTMAGWSALLYPLFLVYMIWIRKYFRKG